ncbi:hypothetical protein CONLIGDRAFT_94022 [Coniochaeta ligniaria NRRL 30616]|uniref:Uncharacterized protein n=1 Tax=Coniochaeta ligniaria NRRL 30616 TaxID=1408157 RepID=A0A1J7ICL5_9PEZI|nr:hypothetical protein CONLIGDRAFT_94022 [Coniochaeta ligniaria NRRL 30616]
MIDVKHATAAKSDAPMTCSVQTQLAASQKLQICNVLNQPPPPTLQETSTDYGLLVVTFLSRQSQRPRERGRLHRRIHRQASGSHRRQDKVHRVRWLRVLLHSNSLHSHVDGRLQRWCPVSLRQTTVARACKRIQRLESDTNMAEGARYGAAGLEVFVGR